ncbi:GNAT family N-acetyltransferase [Pseudodesulfovibrio sp.]|uniref:GNAT family N-acetyltransferase n=1 Tax=unclassified Pseudodesulfovibrio TaxID=2661612 RepID=UPI003B008E3B
MHLLLEADPSEKNIKEYLTGSLCYLVMKSDETLGVCVLNRIEDSVLELYNIAVCSNRQKQGIGTALLRHVIREAKAKGFKRVELGTGTFGYQLRFYQRAGFRVVGIVPDFFVDNYDEPIFESGIQLKDMLRLALVL